MIDLQGTFRTKSAEETLAFVTPLLPKFGISRVADITGLDSIGVNVYQSIRPYSKSLSISQGKGTSKSLAKVSAIMESIETWHAENIREPDLFGSYSELSYQHDLIWPDRLSYGPLRSRDPAQARIAWIKMIDLRTGRDTYVPYSLLNLNFSDFPLGFGLNLPSSNGLASGNTLEEALCHGLCEVIERDTLIKSPFSKDATAPIDLSTIDCPYLQSLIAQIKSSDVSLSLFDITSEIGVPTFAAFLNGSEEFRWLKNTGGFGTHVSKETAVSRAITESLQTRLTLISGARDDLDDTDYKNNQRSLSSLYGSKSPISFTPTINMPSIFPEYLEYLLNQLAKSNYKQVLFYNHTHQEIGIPVVHVMIPGMLS